MPKFDYDVLVIGGGGSAGFTAATTALKSGAKVAMVESGAVGGLCILAGCMPSKTLLHNAELVHAQGLRGQALQPRVLGHKRALVEYLAASRRQAVSAKQEQGLKVLGGRARFSGPHQVEVDGKAVSAAKIVIATGSEWSLPDLPGLDREHCLFSEDFLELESLPESVVVLGGGAVALELGQYALRMGAETSFVQRSESLLSFADPRAGAALREALDEEGANIYTGTELLAVEPGPKGRQVRFKYDGREVTLDCRAVLAAVGRRPSLADLNLEAAGVATSRGALQVDRFMRTSQEHIFAAGDVTGVNMVVNLAVVQGETAGHNATHDHAIEVPDQVIPQAVFTEPQYAKVGRSAGQLKKDGTRFVEGACNLDEISVSRTYPQVMRGFMAIRAKPDSGEILGAELVAPQASLMIHDVAMAMRLGGTAKDLAELAWIHPCLAEVTGRAAMRLERALKDA